MLIETMTIDECFALLARNHTARLACARDNQPYIVPVQVHLEGDSFYGYATLGRKIEWMRANPLVCLEFEELTTSRQWASVVVLGAYDELPRTLDNEGARQVAQRLFQKHPMWWEPAALSPGGEKRPAVVFRIHISSVTGRRTRHETDREAPEEQPVPRSAGYGWLTQLWRRLRGSPAD